MLLSTHNIQILLLDFTTILDGTLVGTPVLLLALGTQVQLLVGSKDHMGCKKLILGELHVNRPLCALYSLWSHDDMFKDNISLLKIHLFGYISKENSWSV